MSNPYQSPQFASPQTMPAAGGVDREKLRRVAKYQQWVLYALLVNICLNAAFLTLRGAGFEAFATLVAILFWPIIILTMVAVFLLASQLYHVAIAVLCTILMIVPCISLLTLLVVNQKAISVLQRHGIKVGFMGVNPNRI